MIIRPLFGNPAVRYSGPVALRRWITPVLPFTERYVVNHTYFTNWNPS